LTQGKVHIQVSDSKPSHSWFHLLTIRKTFKVENLNQLGSDIAITISDNELEDIRVKTVERFLELTTNVQM